MIPKKIHYCWFGGSELPKEAKKCINSWKKCMPDYEIIEWNESNLDLDSCAYAKEAYEHNKWAFVSDYFRYAVLYEYGGIYLDTDVEMIKSLQPVLDMGPFFGREQERDGGIVNSGLGMAAEKGNELYKEVLNSYLSDKFINPDGTENLKTVGTRMTEVLVLHGYSPDKPYNEIQNVDGIRIYPGEYFCPRGYDGVTDLTKNSYTVHLYNASWLDGYEGKLWRYTIKCNNSGFLGKYWWRLRRKILRLTRER